MTDLDGDDLEDGQPSRDLDPDERHQDSGTRPDRSATFRFFNWLGDNLMTIVAVGGLGGFLAASLLGAEVPRTFRVVGITGFGTMAVLGRPVASRAKSMLWDPSYVWLVDLDALHRKGGIWKMPSQRWRNFTVEDGEPDWVSPGLAFVREVDREAQTVRGTWRGTLTDRELLTALSAVDECRNQLEEDAKKGFKWETQAWVIVRRATRDAVSELVDTFERGLLPDEGAGINTAVDDALEEFGLERKAVDSDESPESDVPAPDEFAGLEDLEAPTTDPEVSADD